MMNANIEMTKSNLQTFFETRPAISKACVARESGVSRQMINMILSGERNLTDTVIQKLLPVMVKYGWKL